MLLLFPSCNLFQKKEAITQSATSHKSQRGLAGLGNLYSIVGWRGWKLAEGLFKSVPGFVKKGLNQKKLDDLNLKEINLDGLIADGLRANRTYFFRAKLRDTRFHAFISNKCNFEEAKLNRSHITSSIFGNSNLDRSSWEKAILQDVGFTLSSSMKAVKMRYTRMSEVGFERLIMDSSDFSYSILYNVSFRGSSLRNVDFTGVSATNVNFTYTDLSGVIWKDVKTLEGSLFSINNPGMDEATFNYLKSKGARFVEY